MRWFVFAVLLAIIVSMASALVFLYRDAGQGRTRMVRALAVRVALSVGLFIFLMAAFKLGFIGPYGLK
ncbi:MAG: DUF2909 domain-containing protein [Casimicrobiaceae bacterium]|nr:DUF2909 domain-containing protein [Casimicrobiaceae bacterium]MCX8097682.1 DUF2909 domain-containing protein [Casimicrobiaceae bacterium]MDW8312275.1 DUF2909 domain-containing protein [Burkholderiales bacterium]